MKGLGVVDWSSAIIACNERQLARRSDAGIASALRKPAAQLFGRVGARLDRWSDQLSGAADWPRALQLLALCAEHEASGRPKLLDDLAEQMTRLVTAEGQWLVPPRGVGQALGAYSLLYLWQRRPTAEAGTALRAMAQFLVAEHRRAEDGCLTYAAGSDELLVDTLGMACPFLAFYGRCFADAAATELATRQLLCFIAHEIDVDSALPYHGYRAGGPHRLGLQGWGRGVGWFVIGLADTIIELAADHPARPALLATLERTARSLQRWQRPDGHWSWVVVMPWARRDTSVTAFCGYGLTRALAHGLLPASIRPVLERAAAALQRDTTAAGEVLGSSGECRGLGDYSMLIGPPQPWCQGAAAAFAALWRNGAIPDLATASRAEP
jgi:unsaturated rhamnogalacturonyl hydrolase